MTRSVQLTLTIDATPDQVAYLIAAYKQVTWVADPNAVLDVERIDNVPEEAA